MIKRIGDYYLNMPVQEMFALKELNSEEYKMCESVGIKRIFKDEKIYHGKDINFAGAIWNTMLGATGGCVYKISLQHVTKQRKESDQVFKSAFEYLIKEMSTHSEHDPSSNRYFWDSTEGNVILDQASTMGMNGVQLFLTSSMINQQSDKFKQVFEALKTAKKVFNAQRPSFLKWNPTSHYTDEENLRWCWLRAVEWGSWPMFLSQSIAPVLFMFFPVWKVILATFVLDWCWALIRYKFTNIMLSEIGFYIVFGKWVTVPASIVYFLVHKNFHLALVCLFWPIIVSILDIPTPPTKIGVLQEILMKQLGYSKNVGAQL